MRRTKEELIDQLSELLNDCLEYANQEDTFEVIDLDLKRMKFTVEFDVVTNEEDDYVGFAGY